MFKLCQNNIHIYIFIFLGQLIKLSIYFLNENINFSLKIILLLFYDLILGIYINNNIYIFNLYFQFIQIIEMIIYFSQLSE